MPAPHQPGPSTRVQCTLQDGPAAAPGPVVRRRFPLEIPALYAYRRGDVVSPTPVFRVAVLPLVARKASGVVLALIF